MQIPIVVAQKATCLVGVPMALEERLRDAISPAGGGNGIMNMLYKLCPLQGAGLVRSVAWWRVA